MLTIAYTGIRRSEAIRIEWADVNLEEGFLIVHSRKQSRKRVVSRRIEISKDLMPTFQAQKEKTGHSRWLFLGPRGGQVSRHSLSNAVHRMAKGTKFEGIAMHVFRHSFITNLILAGENPRIIREITGHTSQAMQDYYTHISPEHRRNTINRLSYQIEDGEE